MAKFDRHPKILVTGATGKTGRAVVAQRSRDVRSQKLDRLGAEIVVADIFDVDQMATAMDGIMRAYYCPPFHPLMIQSAAVFVTAAKAVKLEAIVGLSQWTASVNHPSLHTRQVWLVEQMFSAIPDIAYVILNPGYFVDNYLRLIDFASLLGLFPILTGHSRNAPPSNEDIARVAAGLLIDPDRYAGKRFRLTGTKLMSAYDMAGVIRKVLGSPVFAFDLPWWMFERAARLQGVSAFEVGSLRYYVEDHKQGAFEFGAPNHVVEEVTGKPPEDFETIVRRYASMPFARKTIANRLRAFMQFNLVPFTPGYNLNGFERQHFLPVQSDPQFVMSSDRWLAEHSL